MRSLFACGVVAGLIWAARSVALLTAQPDRNQTGRDQRDPCLPETSHRFDSSLVCLPRPRRATGLHGDHLQFPGPAAVSLCMILCRCADYPSEEIAGAEQHMAVLR